MIISVFHYIRCYLSLDSGKNTQPQIPKISCFGARGVAQVVEYLPSKYEALSSKLQKEKKKSFLLR
jgi:hypothetical protein